MPQSLAAIYLHLVFSTKNRIPCLLDAGMRSEMHSFLAGVSRGVGCQTLLVGGVEDHVHVLGRLGRSTTVADWVKEAKRVSTTWAKTRDPQLRSFAWQAGYGSFPVSPSQVDAVRAYIDGQEAHHTNLSFQDEFRALVCRSGEALDERYVWN